MDNLLYLPLIAGVLAMFFALYKYKWVEKQNPGNERMVEISTAIREGAMAFLKREYRVLLLIAVAVAVLLTIPEKGFLKLVSVSFAVGAFFSGPGWLYRNAGCHKGELPYNGSCKNRSCSGFTRSIQRRKRNGAERRRFKHHRSFGPDDYIYNVFRQ